MIIGAFCVWAVPALAAPPANTAAPTISGTRERRRDADRAERHVEQQPDRVPVPVAALQRERRRLRQRHRGDREDVSADERRRRPDDARPRHRHQRRGRRQRAVRSDRRRHSERGSAEHRTAGDRRRPEAGEELTAEEGSWTNCPTSYAYQWQRCDIDAIACGPITGATGKTYGVRNADVGFRLRVEVTAKNANGSGSALSTPSGIVVPSCPMTNARPTVKLISVRFLGARVYARFRICDDSPRNLTILATDSRPGRCPRRGGSRRGSRRIRAASTPVTRCRPPASVARAATP